MKKLFYITSVIVLGCVLASGFIIPITGQSSSEETKAHTQLYSQEFIIKAKGDRIVVYREKGDKPYIETSTAVSSLPLDIQQKLYRGISYGSEESMRKALNEFCS